MLQQLCHRAGLLCRQASQYIFQIRIGIMAIESRGLDQTHHCRRALNRAQRTGEQPIRATQRPRPDLILDPVIIDGYGPIF